MYLLLIGLTDGNQETLAYSGAASKAGYHFTAAGTYYLGVSNNGTEDNVTLRVESAPIPISGTFSAPGSIELDTDYIVDQLGYTANYFTFAIPSPDIIPLPMRPRQVLVLN
jgi:hypothetical protein